MTIDWCATWTGLRPKRSTVPGATLSSLYLGLKSLSGCTRKEIWLKGMRVLNFISWSTLCATLHITVLFFIPIPVFQCPLQILFSDQFSKETFTSIPRAQVTSTLWLQSEWQQMPEINPPWCFSCSCRPFWWVFIPWTCYLSIMSEKPRMCPVRWI